MKVIERHDVNSNPAQLFINKQFMCHNCKSILQFEESDFENRDCLLEVGGSRESKLKCPVCGDESMVSSDNVWGEGSCLWVKP